jgi:biopolymer transport protein ExbB
MDFNVILDILNNSVYPLQGITALYGVFLVIIILTRVSQKRFSSDAAAASFMVQVRDLLAARKFDDVAQLCDSPAYWSKAVPQLILIALQHRDLPLAKLRTLLAQKFSTDVIADLEYRMTWINTVVKTAPMLGLQGTVLGMISAFAKISARQKSGIDPSALAQDISFALWTTAIGLAIAIPLVLCGNAITVRIGKLQDSVEQQVGEFLDVFDAALHGGRRK